MTARASVIVRCRDKAATITDTLESLRAQTVPVEIVVVDSGSTDGTLEIARRYADVLVEIPAEQFTFGGALNTGARAASGDIHFALSAHCTPSFDDWVEASMRHYADPRVAATNQSAMAPDGTPLQGPYRQTLQDAAWWPHWGYSNHGSSWRASVREELPFREDLPACEDKEWSWRVLHAGYDIVYDPHLSVPAWHRRADGLRALWRRVRVENEALAMVGALPPQSTGAYVKAALTQFSPMSRYPKPVLLVSPWRHVELHAAYRGSRTPRRAGGPTHAELTGGRDDVEPLAGAGRG